MRYRWFVSTSPIATTVLIVLLSQPPLFSQAPSASANARVATQPRIPSRTPDGQPDLQGFWTNATTTPLERPSEFAEKQVLSEREAAEFQERVLRPSGEGPPGLQAGSSIDEF